MSWSSYARFMGPIEVPEVKVDGPGRHISSVPPGGASSRRVPYPAETRSGGRTGAPPAGAVAFATAQARQVRRAAVDPSLPTQPWLGEAIASAKGDYEAFLGTVMSRLSDGIGEQRLTETRAVLNELCRTPEGAAAVRKRVTVAVVQQAIKTSKGAR
jgi:hypothetical protein